MAEQSPTNVSRDPAGTAHPDTRQVTVVPVAEQDRAVATIVMAFSSDPVARWFFPDAHKYLTYLPSIVRAFGGRAFNHGSAFQTSDFAAAALWLPPGVTPDDEAMNDLMEQSLPSDGKTERVEFGEEQAAHHPYEEHWYLPMIGVDPVCQGQGFGSLLLQHTLRICDREKQPAFLEATSPRSRQLYERHGFEVIGEIQVGSSPPMWPMWRKPR